MGEVISLEAFRNGQHKPAPDPAPVPAVVAAVRRKRLEQRKRKSAPAPVPAVAKKDDPSFEIIEGCPITKNIQGKEVFDYSALMYQALRAMVRRVLSDVATIGMPNGSQLYITAKTQAAGFECSDALRARFPETITILLDQWWEGMSVEAEQFIVTLNFSDMKETLVIPFDAIVSFVDAGCGFGLRMSDISEHQPEPPAPKIA